MKKTTWVIIGLSICVVVLASALGIVLSQNKPETIVWRDSAIHNSISEIFSEPGQKRWAGGIIQADSDVVILYHYQPSESGKWEENISQNLSPKIKKFFDVFRKTKSIQNLIFSVRVPYEDNYGNKYWMPSLSFEFDKDTYININWKKFEPTELFKYARNIQWHDMTF